ncbi:hypothetical protein B0H11DRAFT_1177715 [Mycena galericulata]|nr:hypothetical protein B0H11DRAFT_1177715 [Mycena galericulata]
MPKAPTHSSLAPRSGDTILRTEATRRYRLAPSDLDAILPVSIRPHGLSFKQEYNLSDVIALDARLNSANPRPTERAVENGAQIESSEAKKEFKLTLAQLHRIKPVSYNRFTGRPMGVYNRCDVQVLADSGESRGHVDKFYCELRTWGFSRGSWLCVQVRDPVPPAVRSRAAGSNGGRASRIKVVEDDYYEDEPNMFDGMTHDDAECTICFPLFTLGVIYVK